VGRQRVIRNFSWVIPRRLAGAALPGEGAPWSGEYILSDLMELRAKGIRHLVSLTDYAREFAPYCRKAGLRWTYFPIRDFQVPEDPARFAELVDTLYGEIAAGQAVCVHCFAGIGRTGLVLACVVGIYYDIDGDAAVRRVRAARPSLETDEQELFVQRFLSTTR
jgi:atypical dual specificity phosphatase